MLKARFNNEEEFIAEVLLEKEHLKSGIVRISALHQPIESAVMASLSLVATAIVGHYKFLEPPSEYLVELRRYLGDYFPSEEGSSSKISLKYEALKLTLITKLQGTEIRPGMWVDSTDK